ncbi:MAG TPA: hypothetical protein VGR20_12775 [Acidimicrobiia bacterium]|jgi:uncharacterized protein YjiS (DUF1127 family)|nr:hypothetical protein [Acidimicrobiia bacterium]
MRSVLVSGPADEATAVAAALRRQGFDTYGLDLPSRLGTGAAGDRPVRPVDCYVQLAPLGEGPGHGSPTRSLLRRVEAVSVVSPFLARDATVLMVADEWDRRRRDALRLMAEAALNDAGVRRLSVVVLDEPLSASKLAATARRREASRTPRSLVDLSPELPYADWRNEVFSLTGRDDGLLREWIATQHAGRCLATGRTCRGCRGCPTGDLSRWAVDVTDAFAEIVSQLRT